VSIKALLLAFAIAQGSDLATTVVGLNRGCEELNPLYGRNPSYTKLTARKLTGVAIIGSIAWGAHKSGHNGVAKTVLWAGIASGGAAAAWNLHTIKGC
jgi:hypothetical protein